MLHLANLITIILIALNLTGLGLAVRRITRLPLGIALPAGTVCLVLVFFFAEHFVGLGRLLWLLPFSTVASAWLVWLERRDFRNWADGAAMFMIGMGYALLWRYFFPNIDASSEKIADLSFVAAYLPGSTLPPVDPWLPPFKLTQYYTFQHYGAALLGRILEQPVGAAYNLGYAVVVGLVVSPVWEFFKSMGLGLVRRGVLSAALMVGGSGAAVIVPLMIKTSTPENYVPPETLWDSMRFAGGLTESAPDRLTSFGMMIKELGHRPGPESNLDLPMEIFSYLVQLGDFHAPLSGFLMLTLSLGAFGLLINGKTPSSAGVILGLCLVTTLACNTWIFPLQLLLLTGFAAHLFFLSKPGVWPDPACFHDETTRRLVLVRSALGTIAGAAAAALLLYPFFRYFLGSGAGAGQGFASSLTNPEPDLFKNPETGVPYRFPLLTPWPYWLIIFWPVLALIGLSTYTRDLSRKPFAWWGVFWIIILIGSELFYFNDDYGGHFERFNSTLKWWPWAYGGALVSLGAVHLGAQSTIRRSASYLIMAAILFYVLILGRTWLLTDKSALGRLDGTAWFRKSDRPNSDPVENNRERTRANAILNYLSSQSPSIMVEPFYDEITTTGARVPRMAFCDTGFLALVTGHQVVLGWASHQQLWRNYNKEIESRLNNIRGLYQGLLPDTLGWLATHDVRFIYWPDFPDDKTGETWLKVKTTLAPAYQWKSFDPASPRYGLFERVK